ncbi:arylsulfatase [Hymenobacter sp. GOD-10R]|uniref:arylsulfatase n=1 Tax=Hymenobacter sp. GOD-10R TaxID=3093922 RepID=UPI002D7A0BFD|nr:arylsulfatase [Hymenobacter sp. GOD-10R]WRQ27981.1 arylsulfatase [Hymenobacter sp. GOD-10R]
MRTKTTSRFTFRAVAAFLGLVAVVGTSALTWAPPKEAKRPNIIVVVADDLGYSDLGCYGGEISTPNLDKLAQSGLRFNACYNTGRCCPTRASLLTGLYPHQAGIGKMTFNEGAPGYVGSLNEHTVTIAEALRSAGYQTGMVGKWHISETIERKDKAEQLKWLAHQVDFGDFAALNTYPTARGFDKYYGTIWGVVDYFDPFSLVYGNKPVKTVPKDFYYTNALGDSAISFVDQFTKSEKPFFLYVAYTAPHWPIQALPEDIKKYENMYKDGWQALRQKRYKRLIDQKLFDQVTTPLPEFMFPDKDWATNPNREWDAHAMAVHAAMVDRMDQSIGQLIADLKRKKQFDNTVILFLADNGASSEDPTEFGPGFDRAGSTRDGQPVAFPKQKEVLPNGELVHAGIGEVWAHSLNTPFRYYKAKQHEGGIATPLIVHWPQGVQQPGRVVREPLHVIDMMSTFLDLAKASYPSTFQGRSITPSPGKSFVSLLTSAKAPAQRLHPELFWEHFGAAALRQQDWKIVRLNAQAPWELYDLKNNRSETKDLASQQPERVKAMSQRWQQLAEAYQAFPKPATPQ